MSVPLDFVFLKKNFKLDLLFLIIKAWNKKKSGSVQHYKHYFVEVQILKKNISNIIISFYSNFLLQRKQWEKKNRKNKLSKI